MHVAKVPHDDRCRDSVRELMVEDADQGQVERVSSRTVYKQFLNQFPQFELVDHRAQECVQVQEQVK